MKTLKITNNKDGTYDVAVTVNNVVKDYDFDNHNKLSIFVRDMKDAGYDVLNDHQF